MDSDVFEFLYLDPEELHLVGEGANGFSPLLAKAKAAVDEALDEAEKEVYSEDGLVKYVSAAARRRMANNGSALPDGAFPIADESHLKSAIGRLGNYKGDKAAARRHIIKRARALGATHLLPKEWGVSKEMDLAQTKELEGNRPYGEQHPGDVTSDMPEGEPSKAAPGEGANSLSLAASSGKGPGDTAPNKEVPVAEALVQTHSVHKADAGDGRGDVAPGGAAEIASDERLALSQTEDLHSKAAEALKTALQYAEKLEGAKDAINEINRATDSLRNLVVAGSSQVATKETDDMTKDEFLALLDEREGARKAEKAKKKEAKKAAKEAKKAELAKVKEPEGEVVKTEEVKATGEETKTEKSAYEILLERIEKLEAQPAARPHLNDAGIRGAGAPEVRGQDASDPFAALNAKIEKSASPQARNDAKRELLLAKMIATERVREHKHGQPDKLLAD